MSQLSASNIRQKNIQKTIFQFSMVTKTHSNHLYSMPANWFWSDAETYYTQRCMLKRFEHWANWQPQLVVVEWLVIPRQPT